MIFHTYRKTIIIIALIFNILTGVSQTKSQLEIYPLTNNTYVYTTYRMLGDFPYPSNSMYLVSDSGIVLLDTPWDTTQFQTLLDSIENRHHKKVILCISTHSHDDRSAGLEYFASLGIKTFTSFQTDSISQLKGEKRAEFHFTKDTIFNFGNYTVETFYPGPGHTIDNICLWIKEEKILYAACFVKSCESKGLGNLADAYLLNWAESLEKLDKKYPNTTFVIPGHLSWKNPKSIKHTLKLVEDHR